MKAKINSREDALAVLDEIKISLQNDIQPVIALYNRIFFEEGRAVGLFAIPRLVFPEIDNLGAYFVGMSNKGQSTSSAIIFIKEYFGRVNPEYINKGAFIYLIYRHGLMHQHTPKEMSYKRRPVGWVIGISSNNVSMSGHLTMVGKTVYLDGRKLFEDLLSAIKLYRKDLEDSDNLVEKFVSAHNQMLTPTNKKTFLKKSYISQKDFDFIKGYDGANQT